VTGKNVLKSDKKKIAVITMGCSKNVVDSEVLLGSLKHSPHTLVDDVDSADVAVINTCGFINSAKQESIDAIIEAIERKKRGKLQNVIVMGCLSERYKNDLQKEIEGVDLMVGANKMHEVARALGADLKYELTGERLLSTPSHFAYVKISEGCDHPCSFCAIPLMRGKHISKPDDFIVNEARVFAHQGAKELILIGQDTTYYGVDSSKGRTLPSLVRQLSEVQGIEWIRLMYAYPSKFPMELLDVFQETNKLCRYLDMPVQHASDKVLKAMRRGITRRTTESLIEEIRHRVPDIGFRTTLIVGFPGEGEKEFNELYDFVKQTRFHRLGVFTYSQEEGTTAFELGDPVPEEVKNERRDSIMELQRQISDELNAEQIGKTHRVLIDRFEGDYAVGRTMWDAPEIDQEVYVKYPWRAGDVRIGHFTAVKIVDSVEYDLYGEAIASAE